MEYPHQPVLVREVLKHLITDPDGLYVDGTVGTGGHSDAVRKRLTSKGRLVCIDRDSEAIDLSRERLSSLGDRILIRKANYSELDNVLRDLGVALVDGILLDLGVSSFQLEKSGRGFSFNRDEPLDMRMDLNDEITAYELINLLSLTDLEKIFREYGEERRAKFIAKTIDHERSRKPINSSNQLAKLIESVIPRQPRYRTRHPATRTFQALRIAVNKELENLNRFLDKVPDLLKKGGRLVILSYHSLEDRMVKQAMSLWEKGCQCPPDLPNCVCGKMPLFRRLHRRGIKPDDQEIKDNPRARSAILRAAERI